MDIQFSNEQQNGCSELLFAKELTMTLAYPTIGEYVAALKNAPRRRFTSPLLKNLQFAQKGIGLDLMTGGLAVVFKASDPTTSNRYAVRCFKGHSSDRQERYSEISKFLDAKKKALPYFVHFEYFDEEIRIKSAQGLPVVLMEWSDGSLLKEWLGARCQERDGARVLGLAERWRQLITDLRAHNLAHGDLQHGNIMVNDRDEFVLIDYDGMAVPNLQGPDSPELGLAGYQHRDRTSGKWNKLCVDLDNFSAINIYLCLRVIAANPGLFERLSPDNDEGLLFHPSDLEKPNKSKRFDEIKSGADPQLAAWIEKFHQLARGPLSAVPALDQFLCDPAKIQEALDKADWDEAVRLADEAAAGTLPGSMQSELDTARTAVKSLRMLKKAIESGDERKLAKVYVERIFANYPAARNEAAYGKLAVQVAPIIDELSTALNRDDGRRVVRIWDSNHSLLARRKSATRYEKKVLKWRQRNKLADKVQTLFRTARTQLCPNLVDAAEELQNLGGHPDTQKLPDLSRIVECTKLTVQLGKLSDDATAEADAQWTKLWDTTLLTGFRPAASLEKRYMEAANRKSRYDRLRDKIEGGATADLRTEQNLVELAKSLPDCYCDRLTTRATTARQLIQTVLAAEAAVRTDCDERTLIQYLQNVRVGGAASLVPTAVMERLLKAELRIPVLEQLQKLAITLTSDADRQFLSVWNDVQLDLANCAEAQKYQQRFGDAQARVTLLAELQTAFAAKNDMRVCALARDRHLRGFELDQSTQTRIRTATKNWQVAEAMLRRVENGDEIEFARTMDVELLSRYWESFQQHQERIRIWMANGALKPEFIGLDAPLMGGSLKRNRTTVQVKWQFPARVTETCVVTFSRGRVDTSADLRSPRVVFQHEVSMDVFERGRSACTLPVGRFEGCNVSVWAVVSIKGERFYSAPLQLGTIPA